MTLTTLPTNSPLSVLRGQGLDAHFSRCRVRVFPKEKITSDIQAYVTTNLLSIVDELNLEGYYTKNPDPLGYKANPERDLKIGDGCLFWAVDAPTRAELGGPAVDSRDAIADSENGNLTP